MQKKEFLSAFCAAFSDFEMQKANEILSGLPDWFLPKLADSILADEAQKIGTFPPKFSHFMFYLKRTLNAECLRAALSDKNKIAGWRESRLNEICFLKRAAWANLTENLPEFAIKGAFISALKDF